MSSLGGSALDMNYLHVLGEHQSLLGYHLPYTWVSDLMLKFPKDKPINLAPRYLVSYSFQLPIKVPFGSKHYFFCVCPKVSITS